MRKFFGQVFGLEYEFTLEELQAEIQQRNLKPAVRDILMSYFKRVSDIGYSPVKPEADELEALVEEAREIVHVLFGRVEAETKKKLRKARKPETPTQLIYRMVSEATEELHNNNVDKAQRLYNICHEKYRKLPIRNMKRVYGHIMRLYEEIELTKRPK